MKLSRIGFLCGAVAGLLSYVLVWLLPASYMAGALGSKFGISVFGSPNALATWIFMAIGVLAAGLFVIASVALLGWFAGSLADTLKTAVAVRMERLSRQPNELVSAEEDGA